MVAAVSVSSASTTEPHPQNPKINNSQDGRRPPLLPSEKDNNGGGFPKKPKSRQVSSRYMSPSPSTSSSSSSISSTPSSLSRRCPSPLVSRNSNPTTTPVKRSASVDRRRPTTPSRPLTAAGFGSNLCNGGSGGEVSAATKLLVTSTRSLSVSFQGEAFSLPISKTKAAPPSSTAARRRPSTPVRGKVDGGGDQAAVDQHRWPGRSRQPNPLSRSLQLDCSEDNKEKKLIGSGNVVRALQKSMIDDDGRRRVSFDGRLSLDLANNAEVLKTIRKNPNGNSGNDRDSDSVSSGRALQKSIIDDDRRRSISFDGRLSLDLGNNAEVLKAIQRGTNGSSVNESDSDSVSSGSTNTSGVQEGGGGGGGVVRGRNVPRGIAVSARFWQETNSRLRRLNDPGSPLSTSSPVKMVVPPKFGQSKKFPSESPLSSPRTMSSPIRGSIRSASPSKLMPSMGSSPARGNSPSRVRSSISSSFSETPSVLSFAVDVRRGKVGENRLVDAHLLRLLYNRQLQWRFVNARTEAALLVQKNSAEKNMWNAWITISDLRDSVTKKRHRLQLLRQKLKLASILKGQITCLEDWASLDKDHSVSLLGAIEALKASTLRLPVVGGAIADVQSVKDAIGSAVDVMQAMASSLYSLLSMVEEVNSLVAELAKVIAKERALLEQCKDFLSMSAALQVKYCSLRTHILQHNRVPTA